MLQSYLPWIFAVIGLALLNSLLYPGTRLVPEPSSAPVALMDPAIAFFRDGINPYSVNLFDNAPISPGPGWILLNAPLSLLGWINLLTPLYLLIACLLIAKYNNVSSNLFCFLLLASLSFLQMSIIGHDLQSISLAVVSLTLSLHRFHDHKFAFLSIAILTGIVATARVPLIVIPAALGICVAKASFRKGVAFMAISAMVALSLHFTFFIWAQQQNLFYQPLHLFVRAEHSGSSSFLVLGAITSIAIALYAMKQLSATASSWLLFMWVCLSVPFMFVGFGELAREGACLYSRGRHGKARGM